MKLTKSLIQDYLAKHKVMIIATYGDHPWIATVYYAFESDLTLYFVSSPTTLHARHIKTNENVAVAIVDTHQKIKAPKIGLQLYGIAKQITNKIQLKRALDCWKKYLGVNDPKFSFENIEKNVISSRLYEVRPKRIKYFNQELFRVEDGKEPVIEL